MSLLAVSEWKTKQIRFLNDGGQIVPNTLFQISYPHVFPFPKINPPEKLKIFLDIKLFFYSDIRLKV
jgi:hypothetical protein